MSVKGPYEIIRNSPVESAKVQTMYGEREFTWLPRQDRQLKYMSVPRNFWQPLPYHRKVIKRGMDPQDGGVFHIGDDLVEGPELKAAELRCAQKAYGKLIDQVKEVQNGWGENLGQRKATFEMMLLRLNTLLRAARALKRGDIRGFCRALGTTRSGTRSKAKKASEIWLEYHFGWEPLYKDIYSGCCDLGDKLPWGIVSASSTEDTAINWQRTGPNLAGKCSGEGRCIVKLSGVYYADNPGLYLLNSLGVINPISVAWELVPFSFAVDWFLPIGQYLQSLTDFVGVHREREYTTVYKTASGVLTQWKSSCRYDGMRMDRSTGIAAPKPTFKLYRGFSVVRGVTAIALLTGMLRSLG